MEKCLEEECQPERLEVVSALETPIPVMARSQVVLLWDWRHESMAL